MKKFNKKTIYCIFSKKKIIFSTLFNLNILSCNYCFKKKSEIVILKKSYLLQVVYKVLIFFVILEMFLEAFCFFIIPVLAIFINSEFNLGK